MINKLIYKSLETDNTTAYHFPGVIIPHSELSGRYTPLVLLKNKIHIIFHLIQFRLLKRLSVPYPHIVVAHLTIFHFEILPYPMHFIIGYFQSLPQQTGVMMPLSDIDYIVINIGINDKY